MDVKDLKPAEYNPRKITDAKLEMLKKSLAEFGDLSGVVFNKRTQRLVSGHQRCKNFSPEWKIEKSAHKDKTGTVALGYIETPQGRMTYREVDWPEAKEKMANVAANKHGGDFDELLLADLITDLKLEDPLKIELLGFDEIKINELLDQQTIPVSTEKEPSLIAKNFNMNNGASSDHYEHKESDEKQNKYPVTFILNDQEYELWEVIKKKYKLSTDKAVFLKMIGG